MIVDDGSSDDTVAVARRWERELDFVTVLEAPRTSARAPTTSPSRRAAHARSTSGSSTPAGAITTTSASSTATSSSHREWFATLLDRFAADERLGLAAGRLAEPTPSGWQQIPIPAIHVHGAVKLYRRECLEAIGGVPERLGWDTIDETYARMRGYEAHSYVDLVARHHRAWGSADGRLRGRARHGECAWILHQTAALGRAAVAEGRAGAAASGSPGAAFLFGYMRAAVRRVPRVEDREFRRLRPPRAARCGCSVPGRSGAARG